MNISSVFVKDCKNAYSPNSYKIKINAKKDILNEKANVFLIRFYKYL